MGVKQDSPTPVRLTPLAKEKLVQIINEFQLDNRNQAILFSVENLSMLRDLIKSAKEFLPYSRFLEFEAQYKLLAGRV